MVINRNGVPVADLVPHNKKRRFIPIEELNRTSQNLPPIDYAQFRADVDELADPYL